jgi:hypothetical protein
MTHSYTLFCHRPLLNIEGCFAIVICCLNVRTLRDQLFSYLNMPPVASIMQWVPSTFICSFTVGNLNMPIIASIMQWGLSDIICCFNVGTLLRDQLFSNLTKCWLLYQEAFASCQHLHILPIYKAPHHIIKETANLCASC